MAPRTVMSIAEVDEPTLSSIAKACNIPRGLIADVYSCTPMQLSMITQARPERFHLILSFGPTADIDRCCQAIRQVVSMNSILRTRFVKCSLGIVQVVTREEHVTERLSGDLEQYLDDDWTRRFGLGTSLFRTAFVDRLLVLTVHHAVTDYTAVNMILGMDIPAAYCGFTPTPRPSFKQFVTYYTNIDKSAARSFWASRFKGAPAIFPRVNSGVIPAPVESTGRKIRLAQIGNGIDQTHVPYYIEAAWALTAAAYTVSDSVAYGYVLSGRSPTLNGLESTLGPTVIEVPVQVNLQRTMTVDWLLKDRATALRQLQMHPASQYGNAAIGAINESARIASGFQTLLNIVPVLSKKTESADIKYDGMLLAEVPLSTKIDELPLLNDHDRSEILSWNKTIPPPTEDSLHELFRAQARAQPEVPAVEASDGNASYSRLDQMSDRLAHGLQGRGVSPGQPVAFIFEKSLWAIVAVLGIMKAGGVCIPIDKGDPYDRKATILSLTKADMILTSSAEYNNLTSLAPNVLAISPEFAIEGPEPEYLEPASSSSYPPFSSDDLAYIIFTGSGTRALKGVLLEHRSLASSLTWNAQRLGWGPKSRIFQFASYTSSMSIMEIFGALLFGGCLCIPTSETCDPLSSNSKLELPDCMTSVKANSAMLPASLLRTISPSQVPGLRWLASVGEPIDAEASERFGPKHCRRAGTDLPVP
ncbi:hypothetical protein O1611_g4291 [Lasiodiplodia mahajangana]|uniref:Uncharacterized protein n=1 Tax=Lasiodiplodia mahajangana TaxID=1108764 RepID=A0ACC2JPR3_9PEZI|nr:hypothetical protein O1611_g4291 [Lasiodiplodia mahajangana]